MKQVVKRRNLSQAIAISMFIPAGVFAGLRPSSSAADGNTGQVDFVRMLDEKRVMLRDMSGSAAEAIHVLRHKYGVPVSFISVPEEKPADVQFRDEALTLREALNEFVQIRAAYTYSLVGKRLVVYPKSGPFKKVIGGIDIRNRPRLEAIAAFVGHLQRTHREFGNLMAGGFLGNSEAPLFTEPVSALKGEATVLEHLAALLGANPNAAFSILDDLRPGTRVCVLEQVQNSKEKQAAEAKDHRTTGP